MSDETERAAVPREIADREASMAAAREHMRMAEYVAQAEDLIADLRARLSHVEAERDDALMAASVNRAMHPITADEDQVRSLSEALYGAGLEERLNAPDEALDMVAEVVLASDWLANYVATAREADRAEVAPAAEDVETLARAAARELAEEVWGDEPTYAELDLMHLVLASDWLANHVAAVREKAKAEALSEAAELMRSCKDSGHWNLRDPRDPETAYSPDVWLEHLAARLNPEETI